MQSKPSHLIFSMLIALLLISGNMRLASAANTVLVIDAKVLRNANWLSELTIQTDATKSTDNKNSYAIVVHDDIVLYASDWLPSLENWQLPTSVLRQTDNSNFSAGYEKALSLFQQAPPDSAGKDRISLVNNGQIKVVDESKQSRFEKWFKLILLPQAKKLAITTDWISVDAKANYYLAELAVQGTLGNTPLDLSVAEASIETAEPTQQIALAQVPEQIQPVPESTTTQQEPIVPQTQIAQAPQEVKVQQPEPAVPVEAISPEPTITAAVQATAVSTPPPELATPQEQITTVKPPAVQTSNEETASSLMSWLIPALIGVAILLVGVFFFLRQSNQERLVHEDHKTDPTLDNLDASNEHVPANLIVENSSLAAATAPKKQAPSVADPLDETAENPAPPTLDQTGERPI